MMITLALAFLAGASQQEPPDTEQADPVSAAAEKPIVVIATPLDEQEEKSVRLGSRVPRKPLFEPYNLRTNTGVAGLTPGSGMDPLSGQNPVIKREITKCVSDRPELGEKAVCYMIAAERNFEDGDFQGGLTVYRFLSSSDEFSPAEQLAAAEKMFAFGEVSEDAALREEALLRMLDSGGLAPAVAQRARRSLVTFALRRGESDLAIARLEDVVAFDQEDAQSFANLAILRRQEGVPEAAEAMRMAIAIREAGGLAAPHSWAEFVATE
ncbi:hypothetical protein [Erythrobacter sp.]|uniref:tetratricopeptide repeat protein n=1 Tax=Erythrobacter sp. TaxID=1042 RepID=UPI00311FE4D9